MMSYFMRFTNKMNNRKIIVYCLIHLCNYYFCLSLKWAWFNKKFSSYTDLQQKFNKITEDTKIFVMKIICIKICISYSGSCLVTFNMDVKVITTCEASIALLANERLLSFIKVKIPNSILIIAKTYNLEKFVTMCFLPVCFL